MNFSKYMKKPELLTREEERELIALAQSGNIEARNRLILGNMRFIFKFVKLYGSTGVPEEDLIGDCVVEFIRAIEKFDPSKGVKLVTYAVWWLRQGIGKNLASKYTFLRMPENLVSKARKALKSNSTISSEDEELVLHLKRRPEQIEVCQEPYIEDCKQDHIAIKNLKRYVAKLNPTKRLVIERYYGLVDGHSRILREISEEVGVSNQCVRDYILESKKEILNKFNSRGVYNV